MKCIGGSGIRGPGSGPDYRTTGLPDYRIPDYRIPDYRTPDHRQRASTQLG
jgi:hypothetical protein